MRLKTLGFVLIIVGLVGGVVAYTSGIIHNSVEFYKVGALANIIQLIGIAFIYTDKE